uniref:hypothetical protein n=1 Tax=Helicobacter bizzozeronii TaxID=56877 RepID=UPI001F1B6D07
MSPDRGWRRSKGGTYKRGKFEKRAGGKFEKSAGISKKARESPLKMAPPEAEIRHCDVKGSR